MANNITIKNNFSSIFAKYATVDEIKALANSICAQVKEAYETRYKEITSGNNGIAIQIETSRTKEKNAKQTKQTTAKVKTESVAKKETDDTTISLTDTNAIKKLGLKFEKYNDRCWVLRGDTKPLRKVLKEQFKGVFNSHLTGGEGWVIKTTSVKDCAKALGIKVGEIA